MNSSYDEFVEPKRKIPKKSKKPPAAGGASSQSAIPADDVRRTRKCKKCGRFAKMVTAAEIRLHDCQSKDAACRPRNASSVRSNVSSSLPSLESTDIEDDAAIARSLQAQEGGGLGALLLIGSSAEGSKPVDDFSCHICQESLSEFPESLRSLHVSQCLAANFAISSKNTTIPKQALKPLQVENNPKKPEVPKTQKPEANKKKGRRKKNLEVSFYLDSNAHSAVFDRVVEELTTEILSDSFGDLPPGSINVNIYPKDVLALDADSKKYEALWKRSMEISDELSSYFVGSLNLMTASRNVVGSPGLNETGFIAEDDHTGCPVCEESSGHSHVASDISRLLSDEYSHLQDSKIESRDGLVPVSFLIYKLRAREPSYDFFQYSKRSVEMFVKFLYTGSLDWPFGKTVADELRGMALLVSIPSLMQLLDHYFPSEDASETERKGPKNRVDSLFLCDDDTEEECLFSGDEADDPPLNEEEQELFDKLETQKPNKSVLLGLDDESDVEEDTTPSLELHHADAHEVMDMELNESDMAEKDSFRKSQISSRDNSCVTDVSINKVPEVQKDAIIESSEISLCVDSECDFLLRSVCDDKTACSGIHPGLEVEKSSDFTSKSDIIDHPVQITENIHAGDDFKVKPETPAVNGAQEKSAVLEPSASDAEMKLFEDSDSDDVVEIPLAKRVKKFTFKPINTSVPVDFVPLVNEDFSKIGGNVPSGPDLPECLPDVDIPESMDSSPADFFSEGSEIRIAHSQPAMLSSPVEMFQPDNSSPPSNFGASQPKKAPKRYKKKSSKCISSTQPVSSSTQPVSSSTQPVSGSSRAVKIDSEEKRAVHYEKLAAFVRSRPDIWRKVLLYRPLHILTFCNQYQQHSGLTHTEEFIRDFFANYGVIGSDKTLSSS